MTASQIASFVDRLTLGKAETEEFRSLTPSDWQTVSEVLRERRQAVLRRYTRAIAAFSTGMTLRSTPQGVTYSEADIIAELEERH